MSDQPPKTIMTERKKRFVDEYLVDLNATQAAKRAGYSEHTANEQGSRLLADVGVASEIARRQGERRDATGITAERVLREISRSAFSDLRRIFQPDGQLKSPSEWDDDTAGAIASIEYETIGAKNEGEITRVAKVKLWDKGKALDQLARHLSLYNDKVQVKHTITLEALVSGSFQNTIEHDPKDGE